MSNKLYLDFTARFGDSTLSSTTLDKRPVIEDTTLNVQSYNEFVLDASASDQEIDLQAGMNGVTPSFIYIQAEGDISYKINSTTADPIQVKQLPASTGYALAILLTTGINKLYFSNAAVTAVKVLCFGAGTKV